MFVVGRELCLLRIEVLHFRRGCRSADYRKKQMWNEPQRKNQIIIK